MNKADEAIHDPFIIDVVDEPISSSTTCAQVAGLSSSGHVQFLANRKYGERKPKRHEQSSAQNASLSGPRAEGKLCPFLHSVGPALIEPKGIRHRVGAGKGSRAGSMRRDISQARTENPTWSIIPDVSPGTSS